jgi:hypothetical protein
MPETEGYRVKRLRSKRRGRIERWQLWLLYGMAAFVGFAAVLGAWYLAGGLGHHDAKPQPQGYLALLMVRAAPGGPPAAAALAIRDASTHAYSLYVIPRDLLLSGSGGEYVMAGDAMSAGSLKADFQRVIKAPLDDVYVLPPDALTRLAGATELSLGLNDPVTLTVGGVKRGYKGATTVPATDVPLLMAAEGDTGFDAAGIQTALWTAAFSDASVRPPTDLAAAARQIANASTGSPKAHLIDALVGLSSGHAVIDRVPSTSRVAEGQFAFLPDTEAITAQITRRAPRYRSRYTVELRNGNGAIGVGEAAAKLLAGMDVNLPAPTNADSFDYKRTEILAGRSAVQVAQDIRAILGRGVVLSGSQLPATTVVVILGHDITTSDLEQRDKQ